MINDKKCIIKLGIRDTWNFISCHTIQFEDFALLSLICRQTIVALCVCVKCDYIIYGFGIFTLSLAHSCSYVVFNFAEYARCIVFCSAFSSTLTSMQECVCVCVCAQLPCSCFI